MRILLLGLINLLDTWIYIVFALLPTFFKAPKTILTYVFYLYLLSEAVFYIFSHFRKRKFQPINYPRAEQKLSSEGRKQLFKKCLNSGFKKGDFEGRRRLISEWFSGIEVKEIGIENVKDWLAWAFWGHKVSDLNKDDQATLQNFLESVVSLAKVEDLLQPGWTEKAKENELFLNFKSVDMEVRPLFYYLVVKHLFQDVLCPLFLWYLGFEKKYEENVPYYIHKAQKKPKFICEGDVCHLDTAQRPAFVFFHGIGVGYLPYFLFLKLLLQTLVKSETDLIIIEVHVVSQHIFPLEVEPISFAKTVKKILMENGHQKALFAGHSFGSMVVSWLLKKEPEMIGGLALIDPAAIYVHHPQALRNMFGVRYADIPSHEVEDRFIHIVFRADPFIQKMFKREYYWWDLVLFPEDALGHNENMKMAIFLSDEDPMIPNEKIKNHIETLPKGRKQFHIHEFIECDHGMFIASPKLIKEFCSVIESFLLK